MPWCKVRVVHDHAQATPRTQFLKYLHWCASLDVPRSPRQVKPVYPLQEYVPTSALTHAAMRAALMSLNGFPRNVKQNSAFWPWTVSRAETASWLRGTEIGLPLFASAPSIQITRRSISTRVHRKPRTLACRSPVETANRAAGCR